jgi:histidinol-phosphate/aromatic aminotransferase/cobyric acid decarboxylase-like protein
MYKHGGQDIYDNLCLLIDDFSVTTNYLGPVSSALDHIQNNLSLINHYPKEDQEPYKTNLLEFLFPNKPQIKQHLLLGNGASELIELIIRTKKNNKEETYYVDKTQYIEYENSCILNNYKKTLDIEDADIICLVNPCNPTGIYLTINALKNKILLCKNNSIILIDESMQLWKGEDFRNDSLLSKADFINKLYEEKNIQVYIIHSWTKFFSCTGLRIGSVLCPSENSYIKLKKHINPWNCNILALEYLNKCIKDTQYMKITWDTTSKLRNYQVEMINKYFPDWKCHGFAFLSWIWIELPSENIAEKLYLISKKHYMPIRWGKIGYNKPTFVRVAVRKKNNFDKLLNIWKNEFDDNIESIIEEIKN